jgi:hypothetical protein
MRFALAAATLALALPALAQQPRPGPARPAPPAQAQPAPPPEPLPGLFPCRTEAEVCTVGIVTGANKVAVLFTNAVPPAAAPPPPTGRSGQAGQAGQAGRAAPAPAAPPEPEIGDQPIDVLSGEAPGTPLDLAPHLGRVVMLTGAYDPKLGLTKAELVEVASPLLSFALKSLLTGDDQAGGAPAQPPSPAGRR